MYTDGQSSNSMSEIAVITWTSTRSRSCVSHLETNVWTCSWNWRTAVLLVAWTLIGMGRSATSELLDLPRQIGDERVDAVVELGVVLVAGGHVRRGRDQLTGDR